MIPLEMLSNISDFVNNNKNVLKIFRESENLVT
jgi:hypothetical protein